MTGRRRLSLHRETVRELSESDTKQAVGGSTTITLDTCLISGCIACPSLNWCPSEGCLSLINTCHRIPD